MARQPRQIRPPAVPSAKPPEVRPNPASRKVGCDRAGRQEHPVYHLYADATPGWTTNTRVRLAHFPREPFFTPEPDQVLVALLIQSRTRSVPCEIVQQRSNLRPA